MIQVRDPATMADDEWISFGPDGSDRNSAAAWFREIRRLGPDHPVEVMNGDGQSVILPTPAPKPPPKPPMGRRPVPGSRRTTDAMRIEDLLHRRPGLTDLQILEVLYGKNATVQFRMMRATIGTLYWMSRGSALTKKNGRYNLNTEQPNG